MGNLPLSWQKTAFDVRSAGIGVQQKTNLKHRIVEIHGAQEVRICGFDKPITMFRPKREMSDSVAKYDRHGRAHIGLTYVHEVLRFGLPPTKVEAFSDVPVG
jgi:hypothetical protein